MFQPITILSREETGLPDYAICSRYEEILNRPLREDELAVWRGGASDEITKYIDSHGGTVASGAPLALIDELQLASCSEENSDLFYFMAIRHPAVKAAPIGLKEDEIVHLDDILPDGECLQEQILSHLRMAKRRFAGFNVFQLQIRTSESLTSPIHNDGYWVTGYNGGARCTNVFPLDAVRIDHAAPKRILNAKYDLYTCDDANRAVELQPGDSYVMGPKVPHQTPVLYPAVSPDECRRFWFGITPLKNLTLH